MASIHARPAPSFASSNPRAPSAVSSAPSMSRAGADDESVHAEKHGTLLEIERLRTSGAMPTRHWSMDDSLDEMQMEARKLNSNIEEAQMVNMMRDFMKLGFTGLELFNSRVKVLELDGWADTVTKDLHKYDAALAKIYRKYWRRSAATPEMEIIMGIGTSLVMHHCQNKFAQKRAAARPVTPRRPPPAPFVDEDDDAPSLSEGEGEDEDDEAPPPFPLGGVKVTVQ